LVLNPAKIRIHTLHVNPADLTRSGKKRGKESDFDLEKDIE